MNEPKNTKAPPPKPEDNKSKGTSYPTISLEKAISMMGKVWEKEKRNTAPANAILEHWGYAAKSSGGFQAIASLKRFGLLEEAPGQGTRSLKVSPMALDLLKYESSDAAAYRKQIKFMALLPTMHELMWKKYGKELPSDKTIEAFLVFDKHMSEESAKEFIKLYKETISFAKLGDEDIIKENNGETEEESGKHYEGQLKKPPLRAPPPKPPENPMNIPISAGQLPIPIADKVALVPFPMSEDDFDLFIGTLQLWKKKLVRTPKSIPPTIPLPHDAMWINADSNKPVKIVAIMGEQNGELYYQSEDGTGIPASQLKF